MFKKTQTKKLKKGRGIHFYPQLVKIVKCQKPLIQITQPHVQNYLWQYTVKTNLGHQWGKHILNLNVALHNISGITVAANNLF